MSKRLAKRIQSFRYALQGLAVLVSSQPNMRIHLGAATIAIACGAYFGISKVEWIAIIFSIALVWVAEALNTAIEFLGDALSREQNPLIGHAKDIGAAAVLLASLASVAIGLLVFVPYWIGAAFHR